MLPYNEYDLREYHKELLRQAEQSRLAKRARGATLHPAVRTGNLLLSLGARLVAPSLNAEQPCLTAHDRFGRTISVCSPT